MTCGLCESGTACPVHDVPRVPLPEHADGYEFVALARPLPPRRGPTVYAVVDPEFPDVPIEVFGTRQRANVFLGSPAADHWPDLVVVEIEAEES